MLVEIYTGILGTDGYPRTAVAIHVQPSENKEGRRLIRASRGQHRPPKHTEGVLLKPGIHKW